MNKLTKKYLLVADEDIMVKESKLAKKVDNRFICLEIDKITDGISKHFDNVCCFLEYVTGMF